MFFRSIRILPLILLFFLLNPTASVQVELSDNSLLLAGVPRPEGDVDGNGKEDIFDLLELLKVLGGTAVEKFGRGLSQHRSQGPHLFNFTKRDLPPRNDSS